ncbi:MAG: Ig-like domain repeat protein [Acidobacteria bacterium]|nr:Ig-like domain repeat protein [Acidobacteriota bacterium]
MVSFKRSSAFLALISQMAALLLSVGIADPAMAQSTPATGDTRTVTEPSYHATCATVRATKYLVSTNTLNLDPFGPGAGSTGGTYGTLGATGATSFDPSSSSGSFVSSESLDNSAINAALSSCAGTGKAVELALGTSGQQALVIAPLNIPSGTGLKIDLGVDLMGSRNLSDYGGHNCGIVTTSSSSCNHLITALNANGSFIEGPGTIDGRGWRKLIGRTDSIYGNRVQSYINKRGTATDGSPAGSPNGAGNNSYGPNLLNLVGISNFNIYKTTLRDSGNFTVNLKNCSNVTIWGVKVIDPYEVSNTDGIDPVNCTNVTIANSFISNGDNHTALKSDAGPTANITVKNLQTGAGIGAALGTDINSGGIRNILFDHLVQRGNLFNAQSTGLQIGSSTANGGVVDKVTYQNVCMVNEQQSVRMYTNYGGQTGSSPPRYTNLYLHNIHVLASTAPYTTGKSGTYTFQGLSGYRMGVEIDNIVIDGTNQGVAQQSGITKDQYSDIYLGPGAVPSSLLSQFSAGTSMSTSGSAGSSTPYPCTTSTWQPLIGEMNIKTALGNLNQSYTVATPTAFNLQVQLQPATEINGQESAALTQPVTFLDGGVSVGTGSLAGDGTFAQLTISSPTPGVHNYTARYPGDSNYPAFTFGSVTVTVGGTPPPPPTTSVGSPLLSVVSVQ